MPKDDARRRRFPEIACLLSAGTRSARRPPKLSEVTIPSATSSASACSTWVLKRRVPSTISWKNDAPVSRIKSITRAATGLGGTPFGADDIADQRLVLGRERRVMGVERTGEARRSEHPREAVAASAGPRKPGPQDTDRRAIPVHSLQCGPEGSRFPTRRLAASNPSSCSITAGMASGPSMRASADTRCQSNRKRKKSRAATGSISALRRFVV